MVKLCPRRLTSTIAIARRCMLEKKFLQPSMTVSASRTMGSFLPYASMAMSRKPIHPERSPLLLLGRFYGVSTAIVDPSAGSDTLVASAPSNAIDSLGDDRDAHAAAMALEAHLQKAFKVYLSDAMSVVEKAPSSVKKLVVLTKKWQLEKLSDESENASPGLDFGKQVAAYLKDTNANILEAVLESLEVDSERSQDLLTRLTLEPKDVQALHFVIRKFLRLGVPRSKIGDILEKEVGILSYTEEQVEAGIKTLKCLEIHDEELPSLLLKYPLIFSPQIVCNVECLREELKAFPARNEIIREAIREIPAKVHEFSKGTAKGVAKLLQGLGLPHEKINKLFQRRLRLVVADMADKIKANVEYLMSLGLTKEQMSKALFKNPSILFYDIHSNIMAKCDYFKSRGFSDADLAKIISRYPNIFSASLDNKVKPALEELRNLGLGDESVRKVVLYRPSLFAFKLGGDVSAIINDLKSLDCPENRKVTAFIKVYSRGTDHRKKTEACLVQLGLSSDEVKEMLEKQPDILGYNEQALTRKVDILTKTLGLPVQSLVTAPEYLSVGLKKRIYKRLCVLSHLKSKGLLGEALTLKDLASYSNIKFYKAYVLPHSKDSGVSKIWFNKQDGIDNSDSVDLIKAPNKESSVDVKEGSM